MKSLWKKFKQNKTEAQKVEKKFEIKKSLKIWQNNQTGDVKKAKLKPNLIIVSFRFCNKQTNPCLVGYTQITFEQRIYPTPGLDITWKREPLGTPGADREESDGAGVCLSQIKSFQDVQPTSEATKKVWIYCRRYWNCCIVGLVIASILLKRALCSNYCTVVTLRKISSYAVLLKRSIGL